MSFKTPANYPLYFEGTRLPDFGAFLDIAASMTPVSEETSMWFWRFTMCIGAPRKERSKVVSSHAKELLAALGSAANGLAPELARKFPSHQPEQVISDWVKSLRTIIEASEVRKWCQWQMEENHPARPTEVPAWSVFAESSSAMA
jgi:hypothetical protein